MKQTWKEKADRLEEIKQEMLGGKDSRVKILRMLSAEAAKVIPDVSLDVVYLDADHTLAGITADLERWWPKIKPGGVFSGHDFVEGKSWIEVKPAVMGFVKKYNLVLFITGEPDWPSWWVVKQ